MTEKQYVITQDTNSLFRRLDRTSSIDITKPAALYFNRLDGILSQILGPDVSIKRFYEAEMEKALGERVVPILKDDPNAVCVCLDRALLTTIEENADLGQRFFRFGICRTVEGKKEPRQGTKSFAKQFEDIDKQFGGVQGRNLVVVDDGLFTGGTVKEFVTMAQGNGFNLNVKKIIAFIGNEGLEERLSVPVEVIESMRDLYDWIDIRDFSVLGGKKLGMSKANNVTSSVPYIYPWSEGTAASLDMSPGFFDASGQMIRAFDELTANYEKMSGRILTFRDMVRSGFPLPTNIAKTIPLSINMSVREYLNRCIGLIDKERQRTIYIFDMDGTLYQLDGERNGFKDSSLENEVLAMAKRFVQSREGVGTEEASEIVNTGVQDEIGISRFLSGRYGITRKEYFDAVWNIDPSTILKNYKISQKIVRQLKTDEPASKFVLLTSAPQVWARQVLKFLKLEDVFETVYTGEQYGKKDTVFDMLATRYVGIKYSIGDQRETDLVPAAKVGIRTFKVDVPDDLELFVESDEGGILCH